MIDFETYETHTETHKTGFIDLLSSVILIFILTISILVIALYRKTIEGEILKRKYVEGMESQSNETFAEQYLKYRSLAESRLEKLKKYEQYTDALSKQIEQYKQIAQQKAQELERLKRDSREITEYKELVNSLTIQLENMKGKKIIIPNELEGKVVFETGKANIRSEFIPELERFYYDIATEIKSRRYNFVQVEGHTDNVPINRGRYHDNWDLGAARAIAVVRYLQKRGIPPEYLSAVSYSEYKPVTKRNSESARKQNRRIEILLLKK